MSLPCPARAGCVIVCSPRAGCVIVCSARAGCVTVCPARAGCVIVCPARAGCVTVCPARAGCVIGVSRARWVCHCVSGARTVCHCLSGARWVCDSVSGARCVCDSVFAARWVCHCVSGARWLCDSVFAARWVSHGVFAARWVCRCLSGERLVCVIGVLERCVCVSFVCQCTVCGSFLCQRATCVSFVLSAICECVCHWSCVPFVSLSHLCHKAGWPTGRHTGREAGRMARKAAVRGVSEEPWWGAELTGGWELTMHPGLGLGVSPLVNMLCTGLGIDSGALLPERTEPDRSADRGAGQQANRSANTHRQEERQVGRQTSRQVGRRVGRQEGRQTGRLVLSRGCLQAPVPCALRWNLCLFRIARPTGKQQLYCTVICPWPQHPMRCPLPQPPTGGCHHLRMTPRQRGVRALSRGLATAPELREYGLSDWRLHETSTFALYCTVICPWPQHCDCPIPQTSHLPCTARSYAHGHSTVIAQYHRQHICPVLHGHMLMAAAL